MSSPETAVQQVITNGKLEIEEVDRLRKTPNKLGRKDDCLILCRGKLRTLVDGLTKAVDAGAPVKPPQQAFQAWKTSPAGVQAWELYKEIKVKYAVRVAQPQPQPPPPAPALAETWTATCDEVWADMQVRYVAWSGSEKTRGVWWGGPAMGGSDGARSVSGGVLEELKRRIPREKPSNARSWWRFSDSWTGGLSFHRTRGGVDFIYHMTT